MRFAHEAEETWRPGETRCVDTAEEKAEQSAQITTLRYGSNVLTRSDREQSSHSTSSGNEYWSGRSA